jgi:hypothetical protein
MGYSCVAVFIAIIIFVVVKHKSYSVFQEASINILLRKGAPASKLVLGLPLYGRIFKVRDVGGSVGFGAPSFEAGMLGRYVQEIGVWGYNEVSFLFCVMILPNLKICKCICSVFTVCVRILCTNKHKHGM